MTIKNATANRIVAVSGTVRENCSKTIDERSLYGVSVHSSTDCNLMNLPLSVSNQYFTILGNMRKITNFLKRYHTLLLVIWPILNFKNHIMIKVVYKLSILV